MLMGGSLLLIYLFFCILVAIAGSNAKIGFWGVLFMSLFLTPLFTAILIVILRPRKK
jgi:fucose permease